MMRLLGIGVLAATLMTALPGGSAVAQTPGGPGSDPAGLVRVGDEVFFRADDGVHGSELWKSDGTEAGTVLVKDIFPGSGSSCPGGIRVGSDLFFSADDGVHGLELWRSDGTEDGTVMVKDITPGSDFTEHRVRPRGGLGAASSSPRRGQPDRCGSSDGTEDGTVELKSIGHTLDEPDNPRRRIDAVLLSPSTMPTAWSCGRATARPAGTSRVKELIRARATGFSHPPWSSVEGARLLRRRRRRSRRRAVEERRDRPVGRAWSRTSIPAAPTQAPARRVGGVREQDCCSLRTTELTVPSCGRATELAPERSW